VAGVSPRLAREEAEERFVDLLVVRAADVVRATPDRHDRHVGDQCAESRGGRPERQDAVVVTVERQRRDVDLRQVLTEMRSGARTSTLLKLSRKPLKNA
jgi:hypothetical protein